MYDSLRDEIERVHAEIALTEQQLVAVGDDACKQRDSILSALLTTDQLLQKNKEEQLEVRFQKSESALTRVQRAAQQLVAQANSDTGQNLRA